MINQHSLTPVNYAVKNTLLGKSNSAPLPINIPHSHLPQHHLIPIKIPHTYCSSLQTSSQTKQNRSDRNLTPHPAVIFIGTLHVYPPLCQRFVQFRKKLFSASWRNYIKLRSLPSSVIPFSLMCSRMCSNVSLSSPHSVCLLYKYCYYYYWSLLYSAILRSRADSLRSHVIRHEWVAFHSAFFEYPPKWCSYSAGMSGATRNCCHLGAFCYYIICYYYE